MEGIKIDYGGLGNKIKKEKKDIQESLLQTHRDTRDKDSKATQKNKEKQILEIYFSYGEDMIRLQGDSRHT